jgi:tetratricopeptide (TPR) repeat protein
MATVARWWPAAVIPLLALVAMSPGVRNGFVHWDDVPYIRENPLLTRPDGLWRIWFTFDAPQYYPLTFTSYWAEYQLWGPWPTGYFVSNLLLHAANSLLVFLVARTLGAGQRTAWLVGALFAVHPIQVSSVAWLAQRKNTLCGTFFFLTMLLYLRYCRGGGTAHYVASLLTFVAALLSKTAAVTLPVSLVLAEWLVLKRRGWAPARRVLPMLLLALGLGIVTVVFERAVSPAVVGVAPRPLAASAAVWAYVGKVLWPATLLALYPQWHVSATAIAWWLPTIGLMAAIVGAWQARQWLGALPVWGLAHFLVTLLPTLGLVPFGYLLSAPIGDHFVYLALPGLLLALLGLVERLVGRWRNRAAWTPAVGAISAAILLTLGAKTWQQVQIWHDGVRLWSHTLAHNPDCSLAHNNLGVALAGRGRVDEALSSYRESARLNPKFWTARTNIGIALCTLGRLDEAVAEFRGMVEDAPRDAVAHFNLANTLVRKGQREEAFTEYAQAVRLNPTFSDAYASWGVALVEAGSTQEAINRLRTALSLDPEDALAHFNLGIVLAGQGRYEDAAAHYREALRIQPGSSLVYTNLGLALAAQGRWSEAVGCFRTALELDPRDALAHLNLGAAAAQAGRPQEAEAHFRATLEVEPENVEANHNLGVLFAQQGRYEEAIPYLSEALRLRPDHANAHYMLGVALAGQGRLEEALPHLVRSVELRPTDREALERLAATQAALGRWQEAIGTATRALELAHHAGDEESERRIERQVSEYRSTATSLPAE